MPNDNRSYGSIYSVAKLIVVLLGAYLAFRNSGSGAAIRVKSMNDRGQVKDVSQEVSMVIANSSRQAVPVEWQERVFGFTDVFYSTPGIVGALSNLAEQEGHYDPLCLWGRAPDRGIVYLNGYVVTHPAHLLYVLKQWFFEAINLIHHTKQLEPGQCNELSHDKVECLSVTYPWDSVAQRDRVVAAFAAFSENLNFFLEVGSKSLEELSSKQIKRLRRYQLALLSYVSPPEGVDHSQKPYGVYRSESCETSMTGSAACFIRHDVPEKFAASAESYGRASLLHANMVWYAHWASMKYKATLLRHGISRQDLDEGNYTNAKIIGFFHTLPREVRAELGPEMCDYLAGYWGAPSYCETF